MNIEVTKQALEGFSPIARFRSWFYLKRARRAAKKYGLDFAHRCAFRHQLDYYGLKNGDGEIVKVPMTSGKTGLYKVTSEMLRTGVDYTGQQNWHFEFQGYAKLKEKNT